MAFTRREHTYNNIVQAFGNYSEIGLDPQHSTHLNMTKMESYDSKHMERQTIKFVYRNGTFYDEIFHSHAKHPLYILS